jgi:DNA-binding PadR family transcriptional regulator
MGKAGLRVLHGLGVADRIEHMSCELLHVEQGSLYPALYRLEAEGWIRAEWGVTDRNRSLVLSKA